MKRLLQCLILLSLIVTAFWLPAFAQVIGGNASLTVGTTSSSIPLPSTNRANFLFVLIAPAPGSTQEVFYQLGAAGVTATLSSPALPSGGICVNIGNQTTTTTLAAITASGSATIRITQMTGCPQFSDSGGSNSAALAVSQGMRAPKTMATFGDSILFNSDSGNLTYGPCGPTNTLNPNACLAYLNASYGTWVSIFSGYRAYRTPGYNCGLTGSSSTQLLPVVSCVLNLHPDLVLMDTGGNDAVQGLTCAQYTANVRSMYHTFMNAGITVLKVSSFPRFGSANFTTAQANLVQCYNQSDQQFAAESGNQGFFYIDISSVAVDPTQNNWQAPAGCLNADNNHPYQATCAPEEGQIIANTINQLIPQWRVPLASNADVYDSVNNPTGNLLGNGIMKNTGSSAAPCSGTAPGNWGVIANLLGSTCAVSQGTLTDGRGFATITVSGTANGTGGSVAFWQDPSVSNFNIGDTIQACAYVQATAAQNIGDITVNSYTIESGQQYNQYGANAGSIVTSTMPTTGYGPNYVEICAPPRTLTAVPTKVEVDLAVDYVYQATTATVAATVNFTSATLRKITP